MQADTILERFQKFKVMMISSDVPNSLLLELLESYLTSTEDAPVAADIPVLEGQLSLFDMTAQSPVGVEI